MKVLENKVTEVPGGKDGKAMMYEDLIRRCLDDVPMNHATGNPIGYTRQDLRNRQRIEDVLDNRDEEGWPEQFKFEDSDAKNLLSIVLSTRWLMRDKDIMKFLDDVEKMETVKRKAKKKTGKG